MSRAKDLKKYIVEDDFPELADDDKRPGIALKGFRLRDGLTQAKLAEELKIERTHVSQMESGKRPIGKQLAKKLAAVFNTDYRVFL